MNPAGYDDEGTAAPPPDPSDVVSALTNLGFHAKASRHAVAVALSSGAPAATFQDLIRSALRVLSPGRPAATR